MFAAKNLTLGQANALYKKLGGEDVVRGILDGTMKFVVEAVKTTTIDLADFFKTRKGLWVDDEFTKRILAPALEMPETVPASVGEPYNFPWHNSQADILEKFGQNAVFEDPRAFLLTLARLIDAQWGGNKEGGLLNNGYTNLFFVLGRNEKGENKVFVVYVYWDTHNGEWRVRACHLFGSPSHEGRRAFPSN